MMWKTFLKDKHLKRGGGLFEDDAEVEGEEPAVNPSPSIQPPLPCGFGYVASLLSVKQVF